MAGHIHGHALQLEVVLPDETCEIGIGHVLHLQCTLQQHVMHDPIKQALRASEQIARERVWALQVL